MREFYKTVLVIIVWALILIPLLCIAAPIMLIHHTYMLIRHGSDYHVTADEIYAALSLTEWKTGMTIKAEIAERREAAGHYSGHSSTGGFYQILARLEEEGFAESRVREPNENDDYPRVRREYRRKANGGRIPWREYRKFFDLPAWFPTPGARA